MIPGRALVVGWQSELPGFAGIPEFLPSLSPERLHNSLGGFSATSPSFPKATKKASPNPQYKDPMRRLPVRAIEAQ